LSFNVFDILHGFGFASASTEIGLPQTTIPFALLFFNVGVEIGQLVFISVVLSIIWLINKSKVTFPVYLGKICTCICYRHS